MLRFLHLRYPAFWLVWRPYGDPRGGVCSPKVCSVRVLAEFPAFYVNRCPLGGRLASPLGRWCRWSGHRRRPRSVSLIRPIRCAGIQRYISCFCLMFTPSFYFFFCMFSRLDSNREEENEVSKTFLIVAPEMH